MQTCTTVTQFLDTMGKFRGPNQKAAAAAEQKIAAEKAKDAKAAAEREKQLQAEWSKGANLRGLKKNETAAAKADEAARKRQEKAALLAEEEENLKSGKPKKIPTLSKKGKKKKNDLSLLEDALVGAADKKVKSKRASERLKEEKEKLAQKQQPEKPLDPLMANTENMISGTEDDLVGRKANKAVDTEAAGVGIDGALDALNIGLGGPTAEPTRKALYKAFEERKMIELKQELPGLKMSQYKDKIFSLWKKSPENPANQQ
eukprot:scaffold8353_cov138-Cylindrotheca_fusiformis.AAC.37